MAEDYYKILGVKRNASQEDIQKAYRKLAREHHPDMNPDDKSAKEKFQKIQQAYGVLNDPEKRESYNRYGDAFESVGGGQGWQSFHGGPQGFQDIDIGQIFGQAGGGGSSGGFEDILRQFTGGSAHRGRRQRTRVRGEDLHHALRIPFNTAIIGGQAQLSVRRPSGKTETITITIPPGAEDGGKMRLRGQGEPSPSGGPTGDLLITVHVAEHPYFRRRGKNLEVSVPVTLAEAALGAKIDVPTPKGEISLTVPPGTSSGKRLRLKGMGVPGKNGTGDLYAELQIMLPESIDDESAEMVRHFDQQHPLNPRSDLRW
ncbi:MAG: J domain-containing protein [Planctomycetes bacterium]|nr:J domain-containing protein [Planctomycetota bacterium]MBL7038425.1 J domain-containing protein [Pirellulaceae bacterium]